MKTADPRRFPFGPLVLALAAGMMALAVPAGARAGDDEDGELPAAPGQRIRPQAPDTDLRAILREVDRGRIEATIRKLASFGTRHTLSSPAANPTCPMPDPDPNSQRGVEAATQWVYTTMLGYAAASGGRMTVEKQCYIQPGDPKTRIPVTTRITNVVATLRGSTSPERVYVISGHIDSRVTDVLNFTADAPGADDDASGVAVVMELARIFAKRHPKATLVFTGVNGEEQGLFGSDFQAKQYKAAGADIQAMFSNDIVGSSTADTGARDPHTLRLFTEGIPSATGAVRDAFISRAVSTGGEIDGPSRQLGRFVKSVAENDETDMRIRVIYRRDRFLRASDHVSYQQQAYPAARFTEPNENFDHEHQDTRVENGVQFGDLIQFVDFAYIARVAKVNAATLYSLAAAPGTPKDVKIKTLRLTNDSEFIWTKGAEPDLAGYEVVWRETTDPEWTHFIPVGNVTTATIPHFSKDNVFFGIRAVDRDGHKSPAAFPVPVNQ